MNQESEQYRYMAVLPWVRNVKDKQAKPFGLEFADLFLDDPRKRRLVVAGPAGSSKTSLFEDLTYYLHVSNGLIMTSSVTYEEVIAECENEFGLSEIGTKQKWGKKIWQELNNKLIQKARLEPVSEDARKIIGVELVGVGKTKRDRGVTALRKIAEEEKEEGKQGSTIYGILIPHLRTQRWAAHLRADILNLPDSEVKRALELDYRTFVLGRMVTEQPNDVVGRKIKERIERSATAHQIAKINREIISSGRHLIKEGGINNTAEFFSSPEWNRLLSLGHRDMCLMEEITLNLSRVADDIANISGSPDNVYLLVSPFTDKGYFYWTLD